MMGGRVGRRTLRVANKARSRLSERTANGDQVTLTKSRATYLKSAQPSLLDTSSLVREKCLLLRLSFASFLLVAREKNDTLLLEKKKSE